MVVYEKFIEFLNNFARFRLKNENLILSMSKIKNLDELMSDVTLVQLLFLKHLLCRAIDPSSLSVCSVGIYVGCFQLSSYYCHWPKENHLPLGSGAFVRSSFIKLLLTQLNIDVNATESSFIAERMWYTYDRAYKLA